MSYGINVYNDDGKVVFGQGSVGNITYVGAFLLTAGASSGSVVTGVVGGVLSLSCSEQTVDFTVVGATVNWVNTFQNGSPSAISAGVYLYVWRNLA